ncbi:sporulation-induced protein [Recurvomyces mirabilis]|uniref:Sporulation-induced protein n=1 Tax=Recurvomyces mirabilis TaxID=574656 RepID=A0AAE1C2T2_9PEZI|nr:sporulation-induced protein [Recurvomyces mirabilis]KAK5153664.1 sporulation-induced protein [Recurvomyces mirabilis]
MFWRFGGYANISTLDTILDKPDVTVEELLDESDLIQELKQQNSKLIEFLREEPVLKKLLKYVVTNDQPSADEGAEKEKAEEKEKEEEVKSPGISFFGKGKARSRSKSISKKTGSDEAGETEHEKQEAQRKKYAYVACEVLSSEVWSITEAVLEHQDHLREFWRYMQQPAPLDPLQAGYFTKVNEALLDKKTEEMLAFFKSLDGIVPAMLQHVDCPMVMDLLLKIISLEKHEGGVGIVDWLQTQDIIPALLAYLGPEHNNATQTSAGDFLKAIITISANATTQDQSVIGPNELTRQLVSEECIDTLIKEMLRGGNALTVGVGIIIEVIRKNNSDYDVDSQVGPDPKTSDPIYLGTALRQFANHVPDFMHLIRSPSAKKQDLKAAFGTRIEPLGFDRFKTCELMAELLHCSNMGLLNERGAEEEVRRRDAERERLKAEGKLATPRAPTTPMNDNSHDEFGSSVDSHGFHHAERPTDDEMGGRSSEGKKLEVQNASDEDGFEKVNPRDADDLPDEVSFDDFNEKIEQTGLPALEKVEKRDPTDPQNRVTAADTDVPAPLSPAKAKSPTKSSLHFDPPPTKAAGDSPTAAGVTDKVGNFSMDEDTVMTEFGDDLQETDDDDGPSELEKQLAMDAAKPAPLSFGKKPTAGIEAGDAAIPAGSEHDLEAGRTSDEYQDIDTSIATIQGEDVMAAQSGEERNGERLPYEIEADGSPVVGDMLKMQFVEHKVVPTILDFFFRFPWNNFLHNVVYDVVQQVFNGTLERGYNRALAFDLFQTIAEHDSSASDAVNAKSAGLVSRKDITQRILDGQAASNLSQQNKGMRLGYMGHLTLIAEEVCKFGNRHPPEILDQNIHDRVNRPEWNAYVDGTLTETREKDNAVLGGVRPENAIGMRNGSSNLGIGGGGGFSSGQQSALASAGLSGVGAGVSAEDSLAMSEGTVGQSFEINSGTMLSGFGDGGDDEDEDMLEDEAITGPGDIRERRRAALRSAFEDDENATPESPEADKSPAGGGQASIPPPLNIPPSRARRQLAARLAQKRKEEEEGGSSSALADPDSEDAAALETASHLPAEPDESSIDLKPAAELDVVEGLSGGVDGLQITGLRTVGGISGSGSASKFEGLFGSEDSSSDDDDDQDLDEDEAGRDETAYRSGGDYEDGGAGGWRAGGNQRRPSTTEAKERTPLSDDEDEDEASQFGSAVSARGLGFGGGPFADPEEMDDDDEEEDSDEELVEIRPRRTS